MNKSISIKSYAKLNLYLEITGRREDGYHLLKSVMQSISLYDTLKFTLSEGEEIEIICDAEGVPLNGKNLIWKAIEAFYDAADVKKHKVTVELVKNIPSMAGMAGGSSNAAAALVAMNEIYNKPLTLDKLCEIGTKLGADVPFCIKGGTVLCEGIGDIMTEISHIPDCCFVVVKPDVSISTPEAYKKFDSMIIENKPDFINFKSGIDRLDISSVANSMYNSLEIACDLKEINDIKRKLCELGAVNSMMTGSGSAVFGIFTDKLLAQKAAGSFNVQPFCGMFTPVNAGVEIIDL